MPTRPARVPARAAAKLLDTRSTRGVVMKIGDLVVDPLGETAILLSEPSLSEDCMPGGEGYPNETYYVVDVWLTKFGCVESWVTDDFEVFA